MDKKELTRKVIEVLSNADELMWAIIENKSQVELLDKIEVTIDNLQDIALIISKSDEGYTCPEIEDSKKALKDFFGDEKEEHHDYNSIFDNPFEFFEKPLRPPF